MTPDEARQYLLLQLLEYPDPGMDSANFAALAESKVAQLTDREAIVLAQAVSDHTEGEA
jgi:hypothetical protein